MSPLIIALMVIAIVGVLCACSRWLASAVVTFVAVCMLSVVFAVAGLLKDEPKI